jgi:hypothetical protein
MVKPDKSTKLKLTIFFAAFTVAFLFYSIKDYREQSHLINDGVKARVRAGQDALFGNTYYYFKTADSTSIQLSANNKRLFSLDNNHKEVLYDKNEPHEYIFLPVKTWLPIWYGVIMGLISGFGFLFIFWYLRKAILFAKTFLIIKPE